MIGPEAMQEAVNAKRDSALLRLNAPQSHASSYPTPARVSVARSDYRYRAFMVIPSPEGDPLIPFLQIERKG